MAKIKRTLPNSTWGPWILNAARAKAELTATRDIAERAALAAAIFPPGDRVGFGPALTTEVVRMLHARAQSVSIKARSSPSNQISHRPPVGWLPDFHSGNS
jgi:hypothetical protein